MKIEIEVAYATPQQQVVIPLSCEAPITIEQAIVQSGILSSFPELELRDELVGIFGYYQNLDHPVVHGDRVEIYRPLFLSPTDARKLRAESRRKRRGRN